jgi:hypothetical protein
MANGGKPAAIESGCRFLLLDAVPLILGTGNPEQLAAISVGKLTAIGLKSERKDTFLLSPHNYG